MRRGEAEESSMIPCAVCPQCGLKWYKKNGQTRLANCWFMPQAPRNVTCASPPEVSR